MSQGGSSPAKRDFSQPNLGRRLESEHNRHMVSKTEYSIHLKEKSCSMTALNTLEKKIGMYSVPMSIPTTLTADGKTKVSKEHIDKVIHDPSYPPTAHLRLARARAEERTRARIQESSDHLPTIPPRPPTRNKSLTIGGTTGTNPAIQSLIITPEVEISPNRQIHRQSSKDRLFYNQQPKELASDPWKALLKAQPRRPYCWQKDRLLMNGPIPIKVSRLMPNLPMAERDLSINRDKMSRRLRGLPSANQLQQATKIASWLKNSEFNTKPESIDIPRKEYTHSSWTPRQIIIKKTNQASSILRQGSQVATSSNFDRSLNYEIIDQLVSGALPEIPLVNPYKTTTQFLRLSKLDLNLKKEKETKSDFHIQKRNQIDDDANESIATFSKKEKPKLLEKKENSQQNQLWKQKLNLP